MHLFKTFALLVKPWPSLLYHLQPETVCESWGAQKYR